MKTTILKLNAFVLLFALMGAGCGKGKEPELREINYYKVEGLSFKGDSCYVKEAKNRDINLSIDSEEEFKKYFECKTGALPQINFSNYTLLAGSRIVSRIYPSLVSQKILVNDENKTVQFNAESEFTSGCYQAFGVVYFYALIPKLDKNYNVIFNINIY